MDPASLLGGLAGALFKLGAPMLGSIIGTAVGGPPGAALGGVAGKAIEALGGALGVPATAEAVAEAVKADPASAEAAVKQVEASAAPALMSELQARLADVADARRRTVELVREGSGIAWGAPVVSVLIVAGFLGALAVFLLRPVTMTEASATVLNILLGALSTAFAQVVNYWLGSSSGSREKDTTMAALLRGARGSPGAVVDAVVEAVKRKGR